MYTTQDFLNDCKTHKERLAATIAKEEAEREARKAEREAREAEREAKRNTPKEDAAR